MQTDTSKILVEADAFHRAMRAALAVAPTKKNTLDLIQLRCLDGHLTICAKSMMEMISIEVPTTMLDVISDRDEVVELTRAEATALNAMKMIKEDPEDIPEIGLIISENSVRRTDETGLGLGIRQTRVKRHGQPHEHVLGDIPAMLSEIVSTGGDHARSAMRTSQLKILSAVAQALDMEITPLCLPPSGNLLHRTLWTGDQVLFFAAVPDASNDTTGDTDTPDGPPADTDPLNFDDPQPADSTSPSSQGGALRVVQASPRGGIA